MPIEPRDMDDLVALDSDPEVMRFINGGVANSREDYEAELLPRMLAFRHQPYGYLKALSSVGTADTQVFVGWFHLRPSYFEEGSLELGYRLQRRVWGQGLATEGGKALVAHAFEVLKAPIVDACALADNLGSIRVMEKCGLRFAEECKHPRASVVVQRYICKPEA